MQKLILIPFILLMVSAAFAGAINIPLQDPDFKYAPASDLIFEGTEIDEVRAMELASSGIDLSELNPKVSTLFKNKKLDTKSTIDIADKKIVFHSSLPAPTEFYRASINVDGINYTLSSSLYNHATMIRAHLLRLMGYDIEIPQYLHSAKVTFDTLLDKKTFLDSITESTLLSKSRWVKDIELDSDDNLVLTLKGVLIEPADLKGVPVYWPIMEQTRQEKRRVFRSLLYLFTLTDFNEQINEIEWSFGKVFNNELILTHAYSEDFSDVTIDDIKWMHKKMLGLNEQEVLGAIKAAHLPNEIEVLIFEKIKARLHHMGKLLNLPTSISGDEHIQGKGIFEGKLLEKTYEDYVPIFWEADPLSPFRFSEMFKLFRTQIAYDTMSGLLDQAIDKFVPAMTSSEAIDKIKDQIQSTLSAGESAPLKMWSYPTASGRVTGNRSIIFGQYLGTTAPIQLVDSVEIEAKLGLYSILTGVPGYMLPNATLGASLSRSWKHVRAMPDLSTATEQKIKKILVPQLMKKLGRVLKDDHECSLTENAWYTEEIMATVRMWVVYYDKDQLDGKDFAMKLREKLIQEGKPADKILLSGVNREVLCERDINDQRKREIDDFIKEFALNETIVITDSINLNAEAKVKVNAPVLNPLAGSLDFETSKALLRALYIRKTELGLEITLQTQNNLSVSFSEGIEYFIQLLKNTTSATKGHMISKVYKIKLEDITEPEKIAAIKTLREIFIRNSFSHLKENYNPIELDHEVRTRLNTFRFLWFKAEKFKMNHEVEVVVPNNATNVEVPVIPPTEWEPPIPQKTELTLKERTKLLYSSMILRRKGNNYHVFLDRTLNDLVKVVNIGLGSSDQDPGQSIFGKSQKRYYVTESEITEGAELSPTTKIEYIKTGWAAKTKEIGKLLSEHEEIFKATQPGYFIDRMMLAQTNRLRSYDLRTTIILYPSALKKIEDQIFSQNESGAIKSLYEFYGKEEWDLFCQRADEFFGDHGPQLYSSGEIEECVPPAAQGVLGLRKKGFSHDAKEKTQQINMMYEELFEEANRGSLLKWLGSDNFFGSTHMTGFRTEDATGYLDYTSDTVGTYQTDLGTGLFDNFALLLGINAYELKAMTYSPNML